MENRPDKFVSDNPKSFVAIAKWLRKLKRSQIVNDCLAQREIHWQFNFARILRTNGWVDLRIGNANLDHLQATERGTIRSRNNLE